jgi:hypothetical protein
MACVGAGGDALPPSLIFQGMNGNIQSDWVQDIYLDKHQVFYTSASSGWSNNDVGLAWLEQVFDRHTKAKARRSWRMLTIDGHGSHVTLDFIEYCYQNKILLLILPPHSTHTLQPLDVVMFKSLSSGYTQELTDLTQRSQGYARIKKGDFFLLFWNAWKPSFIKDRILKSFSATGIWPKNSEAVLQSSHYTTTNEAEATNEFTQPLETDWRKIRKLINESVKDGARKEAKTLTQVFHHLQANNELITQENAGLREAVQSKKKHKKKGVPLDLQQRQKYHGGAVMWSPRKGKEAGERRTVMVQQAAQQKLDKAKRKQDQKDMKVQKQLELEQRRDERERVKKEREKEKAKKQAEQQRKKAGKPAAKATQNTQQGKRKASQVPHLKNKRQNNLWLVHQRMQPQKLPHHPNPELLHGDAASPYPKEPDSTI